MTSPSVGWSRGALRTTDGGADWHNVVPNDMWADAPAGTSSTAYPPGYVDYFLDSNHAWLAYSYPSRTSCFDHVSIFSTSDGGRTWKRSHPVKAAVQADSSLQLQMFFLDSQHGWLMVLGSGRLAPDWFVYTTSNGGLDWQLLAQLSQMSSWCSVQFVTITVGFLGGCSNSSGPAAQLTVTRDGGRTWGLVNLPATPGTLNTVGNPVFFNPDQGVVLVTGSQSPAYLAITADGGQTWRTSPASLPGYPRAFAAIDLTHFVADFADSKGFDFIARTADGGQTWVRAGALPIVVPSNPNILVVDPQHLFIEDMSQTIAEPPLDWLVTMDGGRTWKDVRPRLS